MYFRAPRIITRFINSIVASGFFIAVRESVDRMKFLYGLPLVTDWVCLKFKWKYEYVSSDAKQMAIQLCIIRICIRLTM